MLEVTLMEVFQRVKFYHQTTQEDGHYKEYPLNHEIQEVRRVDCRASQKVFGRLIPL